MPEQKATLSCVESRAGRLLACFFVPAELCFALFETEREAMEKVRMVWAEQFALFA